MAPPFSAVVSFRSVGLSVNAFSGFQDHLAGDFYLSNSAGFVEVFQVEAPCRAVRPSSWDLLKVLEFLRSPVFEPIAKASLRDLTRKTLFLVALATAKRVGELQVLSRIVSFSSSSAVLA